MVAYIIAYVARDFNAGARGNLTRRREEAEIRGEGDSTQRTRGELFAFRLEDSLDTRDAVEAHIVGHDAGDAAISHDRGVDSIAGLDAVDFAEYSAG